MNFDLSHEKAEPGLEQFCQEFLTDREDEYQLLIKALADSNFEDMRSLGHKWKGFCTPYGFNLLGELAAKLEVASEQSNKSECQNIISSMSEYLTQKRESLK